VTLQMEASLTHIIHVGAYKISHEVPFLILQLQLGVSISTLGWLRLKPTLKVYET
jgi:hypothetical protein